MYHIRRVLYIYNIILYTAVSCRGADGTVGNHRPATVRLYALLYYKIKNYI